VNFRKQPNREDAEELLKAAKFGDLKDKAKLTALAKSIIEGEPCNMICHLVKAENHLGRSTVIDLTAKTDNKFRQIDHRTIESIIFKNVKYSLKKGAKKIEDDEEKKKDEPKWDSKKLAVGNWFSGTSYFKIVRIEGDEVVTSSDGKSVTVSKDICEYEMHNSSVYSKEEKMALTKVVKVLKEAHSSVLQVAFNCKTDDKQVQEKLSACTEQEFKNAKQLAQELLLGRESVLTGRLSTSENNKLGRSLFRAFDGSPFAQIDHRTIRWLILKDVKYIVQ